MFGKKNEVVQLHVDEPSTACGPGEDLTTMMYKEVKTF